MNKKIYVIIVMTMIFSMNGFGQKCTKFINYQTKDVDTKGLNMQVFGQPVGVGATNISTLQREVSDELQKFDMMQSVICEQLKSIKSTFQRDQAQVQYSNLLMKMMNLINSGGGNVSNPENEVSPPPIINGKKEEISVAGNDNGKAEKEQPKPVNPPQDEITPTPVPPPAPVSAPCEPNTYKSDKNYLRGFGYGESKNRGMAKDYASSDALEALALGMEVTVKVVGQHYRLSAKKDDTEDFEARLEKTTQTSINQTIRNISTVCEGETKNPNTNNWEYYIVYEVSREDAVKDLYNSLQKDPVVKETLPNHEKFKQTFDDVMKEYDKSKEISFVLDE
jgi:hypothetical protein